MWRKSKKYNLNVALKVKKWDSNHKEPNLYFNLLIFFLANCIILLGPAIFKHLVSAVLICTSHKATLPLISLLRALLRGQLLRRCSCESRKWGNPVHMQLLALLATLGAPAVERCGKKDDTERVLAPWLHLSWCHRNSALKQYQCCVFSHWKDATCSCQHPQKHFCLVFLWISMVNHWQTSEVLQGLLGCTSHQGLTTHLEPCCQMWWTVEMDKWWNSWDHPLIQGHFSFLLAAKVRESTVQWQEIVGNTLKMREIIFNRHQASCCICWKCSGTQKPSPRSWNCSSAEECQSGLMSNALLSAISSWSWCSSQKSRISSLQHSEH